MRKKLNMIVRPNWVNIITVGMERVTYKTVLK